MKPYYLCQFKLSELVDLRNNLNDTAKSIKLKERLDAMIDHITNKEEM